MATSKTATTAARIFSRLDSVEEVQRGRSGSAVGITPPGGPGAVSAGVGSGSGAGTVAAAVVATGSPARSGQQQYVGGGGVGGGGGGVAGSAAVGVAGAGGVAAVRQRSASTVLDINLPQRKVSVGGGLAGPPSPVIRNGFSVYDPPQSLISSRHANFNGQGVGGGGAAGAIAAGGTATGVELVQQVRA
ncbi:glycine-rich cell wall structural protein 1-like [Drosophila simulans]|uniref:glycine-rich cell wall structural protein 1-like n=1 Tax=Drosophila simulans TaxID=7240 RepID=UPI001D117481|nr:glycine-rich cell wall structural protein 1-like [Drosophila simulans]